MANAENVREVETASMNDIIDLNVGGTKFQTTRYLWPLTRIQTPWYRWPFVVFHCVRQTLLHDPNSMLARMFDPVSPLCPGKERKTIIGDKAPFILTIPILSLYCYHMFEIYPNLSGVRRDGAYFLDRDPIHFRPVINYLRSGQLTLDRWRGTWLWLWLWNWWGIRTVELEIAHL